MKINLSQLNYDPCSTEDRYNALVTIDDVPAFWVFKHSRLSKPTFTPLASQTYHEFQAVLNSMESHIGTFEGERLPDGTPAPMTTALFFWLLAEREFYADILRTKLRSFILFITTAKRLVTTRRNRSEAMFNHIRKTQRAETILNTLPFEEALDLYLDFPQAG